MTRGTIALLGPHQREAELLATRLERENYEVVVIKQRSLILAWLKKNAPQAILIADTTPVSLIAQICALASRQARYRSVPVILVTDEDTQISLAKFPRLGEIVRLHRIPVAEAVRRIKLAIQLCQVIRL